MKKFERLTEGTRIETLDGHLIIKSQHNGGRSAWVERYEATEDGELVLLGDFLLTLAEIGHELQEVDGHTHNFIF